MRRYRLTRLASADLYDIFLYGYERFGEHQANAYAAGLERTFHLLAENPEMGRKADTIAPGIRRLEHRSHVVLYELTDRDVLILAIVHGRSVRFLR